MKTVTPFDIFSLFHNAKLICKKGKDIKFSHYVYWGIWDKTKEQFKIRYKKLWNKYENGFFTLDQLKLCILYEYLFRADVNVINIDEKEIPNVDKHFTKERYLLDMKILSSLKENHKIRNIKSLFEDTGEGESVIYNLTKKKHLSPMVFINYIDKLKEEENKEEEYLRFKRIIRIIKQELKEEENKRK